MTCQKNRLSRMPAIALCMILLCGTAHAGKRDDLYESGLQAYESGNHVTALKNLYAFYLLNEADINARPDFKKKLLDRISGAEAILRLSFAASPAVQESAGRVRILTRQGGTSVSGSGKQIEDLMNNKTIDLQAIQNVSRESLMAPSNGQ